MDAASSSLGDSADDEQQLLLAEPKQTIHCEKVEINIKKSANMDILPWITEFRTLCRSAFMRPGLKSVIKLMRFLTRNINSHVNDCSKKTSQAVKLKQFIQEALPFFTYYYQFVQPQDQNDTVYLEQMSDLLAAYTDLELVASKQHAEQQHGEISARLVCWLWIYLEKSSEHVLDTLLKVQLMSTSYCHILDAVFSKLFKLIPLHPETKTMYVRYFLAYRLWKKIHTDVAIKEKIDAYAASSLGLLPEDLPKLLVEQVLPSSKTTQSTESYLYQVFDLRSACSRFLQFCKSDRVNDWENLDDDITEREQRLKSSLTSETNNVESVNIQFSKSLNSIDKLHFIKNVINIPFKNLEIDSKKEPCSSVDHSDNNKAIAKPPMKSKNRKPKKFDGIIVIDLTDEEEVTKIIRHKKNRKLSWLEIAKRNIDMKVKDTALKNDKNTDEISLQIFENQLEDSNKKSDSDKSPSIDRTELESKSSNSFPITLDSEINSNKIKAEFTSPTACPIKKEKSTSNSPDSSTSKLICYDNGSISEDKKLCAERDLEHDSMMVIKRSNSNSITVTSSKILRIRDEETKISALRNDSLCKDKHIADSAVSSGEVLQETSSNEKKIVVAAAGSCSIICTSVSTSSAADKVESKKIIENISVNSNATKTDYYPNEQKVQHALIRKPSSLLSINEYHNDLEDKIKKEEYENVYSGQVKDNLNLNEISHIIHESRDVSSRQFQPSFTQLPASSTDFYNIHNSDIDGLTLLASVSAQQQVSPNKKIELKVKPYSSLQQKPKNNDNNDTINNIVGVYPEDNLSKVALQVEISSTGMLTNAVNKYEQHHDASSTDMYSYILNDSMQNNLESNENANVILDGETVMLLQKSPNSNLYIINKAAVDNTSGSKINCNMEEEDVNRLLETEETKYSQHELMMKYELDSAVLRGRAMKPDPDYVDAHDDSKHQNQAHGYDLHYPGYPVPPLGGYCTYPKIHHPSTGHPCVNYPYYHQLPYYLPATHATQLVQTNPAAQEKRSNKKTEATAMLTKIYDDQLHCDVDKSPLNSGQQQQKQIVVEESKDVVSRFEPVAIKLPLKKRLTANMQKPKGFVYQEPQVPLRNEEVAITYPGTLMMSIADVEPREEFPAFNLGAVVEVTTTTVNSPKTRGGHKEKTMHSRSQCSIVSEFISKRTNDRKKKVPTDEEVENNSAAKKSRKSTSSQVKQTRSSKRIVPTVNYVYPEIDPESNPSGKRKKKRR